MDRERWSDEELLAAKAEDPEAFGVFYRRHVKALLAYLAYRVRDGEHAVDLCSEVFAAALESSRRFRTRDTPARAWLFGIANNKVADSVRRGQIAARAREKLGIGLVAVGEDEYERVEALVDSERRDVPLSTLLDDYRSTSGRWYVHGSLRSGRLQRSRGFRAYRSRLHASA